MEADNRQFDGKLFLKDVNRKLNDRLAEIQKDLNQGLKEIENMHEYYWENYTEMDQYGYEDYDNQQALLQQVNANRDKSKLMKRLEKMIDSPFFGRVDFLLEAEEEEDYSLSLRSAAGNPRYPSKHRGSRSRQTSWQYS